jgi:hypothetical protein
MLGRFESPRPYLINDAHDTHNPDGETRVT